MMFHRTTDVPPPSPLQKRRPFNDIKIATSYIIHKIRIIEILQKMLDLVYTYSFPITVIIIVTNI
jgi:hypothetical protein